MGSETPRLLSVAEVAERMGVTKDQVHRMTRAGYLRAVYPIRRINGSHFDEREVSLLMELGDCRSLKVADIARMSAQALVLARLNDTKVKQLCLFLGIDKVPLSTEEDDVVRIYLQAQDHMKSSPVLSAEDVLGASRILLSMNEEYLMLVGKFTGDVEPWRVFLDFARTVSSEAPRDSFDSNKELESAYAYFEAARRHMRNVAYFYVRGREGKNQAGRQFPESKGEYSEPVLQLLFPH